MTRTDIQQEITDTIIQLLDQVDLEDYEPPFASLAALGIPENPITQQQYHGVNILALWFNQKSKGLASNQWASYRQWQQIGAKVKKGEKGSRIIFYKTLTVDEKDKDEKTEALKIPMLKQYIVFNAAQVEGYEGTEPVTVPEIDRVTRHNLIEVFCRNTKADIREDANEAFYNPSDDYINMPKPSLFVATKHADATENYYGTLLHELTHWTGHTKRLDRKDNPNKKYIQNYAYEELIAELGASFLCARFNTKQTQPINHALYIKSWLKALQNEKTVLFRASAQAAKAVAYLEDCQSEVQHD